MIVLDASTLVSATFNTYGVPAMAVRHALGKDQVAISQPVLAELSDVLYRAAIARFVRPELRSELLGQLVAVGVAFQPVESIIECRDWKDNKYLELALASRAGTIVSSDADLLVLHPWRAVRILRPAEYLAAVGLLQLP